MSTDLDLIEATLDELAPLSKPTSTTPSTIMDVRNIMRRALMKYDAKLRENYHVSSESTLDLKADAEERDR